MHSRAARLWVARCTSLQQLHSKQWNIITNDEQWPNTLRFAVLFPLSSVKLGRSSALLLPEFPPHTPRHQTLNSYLFSSAHNANNPRNSADHSVQSTITVSYLNHNRMSNLVRHWLNLVPSANHWTPHETWWAERNDVTAASIGPGFVI